ncbi:hypothetical protein [Pseudonocardia sp. GCM10023141]|uniref:hypothetical protein n=1 Tax=Pseudonocardia sp. GCM10023141 TaxID=3252653 RepID=UPI003623AEBB
MTAPRSRTVSDSVVIAAVADRVLTRGQAFADLQRRNIRTTTLDRLKADVEC